MKRILMIVSSVVFAVSAASATTGNTSFDELNGKPYSSDSVNLHTVHKYSVTDLAFDELNGKPYKVEQKFTLTCDGDKCKVTKD